MLCSVLRLGKQCIDIITRVPCRGGKPENTRLFLFGELVEHGPELFVINAEVENGLCEICFL